MVSKTLIGSVHSALVTNFYGVYEVEAHVVEDTDLLGRSSGIRYVFSIPMVRGKNGREKYFVHGSAKSEGAGFCLLD